MKCDKPATHKITKIVKGKVYDVLLCDEHARDFSPYIQKGNQANLVELLQQILKRQEEALEEKGPVCENCGLAFSSYRKTLLLGCSECYAAFESLLKNDLRKIHGATAQRPELESGEDRRGLDFPDAAAPLPEFEKTSIDEMKEAESVSQSGVTDEAPDEEYLGVEDLRTQMREAIGREDFETAASLRDSIKNLESLAPNEETRCGNCGAPMRIMRGPKGPALVCGRWPECRNSRRPPRAD
jgi:protein arginine kinase activator